MISKREFITLDIIENNMDLPWDWEYVNGNPNITIEFLKKHTFIPIKPMLLSSNPALKTL